MLVIQAYKTLRDRGPFPADKVVAALNGHFVFVLYDTSNRTVFVAQGCEGEIPFYWGTAADKSLAFSDMPELLKSGCGKSFAPFPAGCYFSSNMGLQSYEHPLQKLKPVPCVDSQGQALGAAFKVDMSNKDKDTMHGVVGSEANWAQSISFHLPPSPFANNASCRITKRLLGIQHTPTKKSNQKNPCNRHSFYFCTEMAIYFSN